MARVETPAVPQSMAASTIRSRPPRLATWPDAATESTRDIVKPILSTQGTKPGGQDQPGHASGVPAPTWDAAVLPLSGKEQPAAATARRRATPDEARCSTPQPGGAQAAASVLSIAAPPMQSLSR